MTDWLVWLKSHKVHTPIIEQVKSNLYWSQNNCKKQINWFDKYLPFHQKGMTKGNHQLLKAIYGRLDGSPLVLDACAGLGYDAFLMSLGGCRVIACEKNPQIFALLANMYARSKEKDWYGKEHLSVGFCCSMSLMNHWPSFRVRPDIIYLDPMFEKKFKGEVKANASLLKSLAKVEEMTNMFNLSLAFTRSKVVVKRPLYAESISSQKPTYMIKGKTTRYDVYQV